MSGQQTTIRLIDVDDAAAIVEHRIRDAKAFAPWEPEQPESFYTVEGQRARIEQMLEGYRGVRGLAFSGQWFGRFFHAAI
ncbi:hypothetical protein [Micromonospora sp. LOL_023]|uniref:hypothetical protein n=1 Tax=Micromonospora sp. LOL_023 TaxID=3345418 RepID=UPI003A85BB19